MQNMAQNQEESYSTWRDFSLFSFLKFSENHIILKINIPLKYYCLILNLLSINH